MRRFLAVALGIILALVGLVPMPPAQAVQTKSPGPSVVLSWGVNPDGTVVPLNAAAKARASAPSKEARSCTWEPDGKCYWYTGPGQFNRRSICFQNNLGVYWNYVQAQQGFESGTSTVKFYNHGASTGTPASCESSGDWLPSQILYYQAYGTDDGRCFHFTQPVDIIGYYDNPATIWMNASPNRPAACTDTLQHRNNNISRAIGIILGLAEFSSSTNLTASVMNTYFSGSYNFPGVDDRNALYWLYYYNSL
ncbi:hypothetical protein [Kribbella sp. NPDC055071]